ncbi:MAG: flagellar biosynthetic protein FliO [Gammaproteobacteria bacterium]|nr:flagellar biosynthetic protein FliO [Gammaproteobacteria bacterium]
MPRNLPVLAFARAACGCLPLLVFPVAALAQGADPALAHKSAVSFASVLQMITGLGAVLALIFAGAWVLRRYGRVQGVSHGQLRVVGGINLGQRERIVIVQAGTDRLLVGVAPGCIRTLHVLEPAPEPGAEDSVSGAPPASFLGRFNQELRKRISPS